MSYPIVDLHCDLLDYLTAKPQRSVEDKCCRCSYPDLKKGGVKLQTLAIYTQVGTQSVESGKRQVEVLQALLKNYPLEITALKEPKLTDSLQVMPAFESASGFASEEEPLEHSFKRLESYLQTLKLLYISLTWNEENRFGGGNETKVGLKEDGKRLLDFLSGKHIAIDLSHTSDHLAYDLINWIDKNGLDIPLMASHSNFRAICNRPRNLPEDLAKELIRRKGVIGLNFVSPFIHETDHTAFARHLEYALSLGGEEAICFGADFFYDGDNLDAIQKKYGKQEIFYPELSNSSCYPYAIQLLQDRLGLKPALLEKLCHQNAFRFIKNNIYTSG